MAADRAKDLTLEEYERLDPHAELEHQGVRMYFATPSTLTLWRVQSIHEKEPWTLEWIAGFGAGEVMLDCGANVGMYSIWAAATRGATVYAFEPESQNYALLTRNIFANRLSERIHAFCMALSNQAGLSTLYMADLRTGGSNHAVGEALNFQHEPLDYVFAQRCIAGTIDELVGSGQIPVPKEPTFRCPGGPHYPHAQFERLWSMPFLLNSLFAFFKTDNSFHGVEPVADPDCRRWLLLYDLYLEKAPAAAPARPSAETLKFSF